MTAHVDGADEAKAALTRAAEDVTAIDMGGIATESAKVLRGFIPVASGRARDTIRPEKAEGRAVVSMGGPAAPYVSILRSIHPSRFVQRHDDVMETRLPELLEQEWDAIATRNGLT